MALPPISPGSTPQFRLTPSPAGVSTSIENIGWAVETTDPNAFDLTMTSDADDPTGMTATLFVPADINVGATIIFWTVYRNPNGTEVTGGPWSYPVESSG